MIAATPVTANGLVDDTAFQDVTVTAPAPTLTLAWHGAYASPTVDVVANFNADGATTSGGFVVNWGDANEVDYSASATRFSHTYTDGEFCVGMDGTYFDPPGVFDAGFDVTVSILRSVNVTSAAVGVAPSEYTANVPGIATLGYEMAEMGDEGLEPPTSRV